MKRGITLVEMLVVVVIVGIVASLGVVQYNNVIANMQDNEAKHNLKVIRAAAWSWATEHTEVAGGIWSIPNSELPQTTADINSKFGLNLPTNGVWNYRFYDSGCIDAKPNGIYRFLGGWKINPQLIDTDAQQCPCDNFHSTPI